MDFYTAPQLGGTTATPSSTANILLQVVVPLAAPALALVGVWYQGRRKYARRLKSIKEAVDLYGLLPDDSTSRAPLRDHIDRLVESYVSSSTSHRRDKQGISFATIFLIAGCWCSGLAFFYGGWWNTFWLPAVFFLLFGVAGFAISWPKKDRDERGTEINEIEPDQAVNTTKPSGTTAE